MDPTYEYLRESLDDLRKHVMDQDLKNARDLGVNEGWRSRVEAQLDRMEKRLDSLVFLLLTKRRKRGRADKRRGGQDSNRPEDAE